MFKFGRLISVFPGSSSLEGQKKKMDRILSKDRNLRNRSYSDVFFEELKAYFGKAQRHNDVVKYVIKLMKNKYLVGRVFDAILPTLKKMRFRKTKNTRVMYLLNKLLFAFHELTLSQVHELLDVVFRYVKMIGHWKASEREEEQMGMSLDDMKVKNLVRVYFGVLFFSCHFPCYGIRTKGLSLFNKILEILEPFLSQIETTFHFSEEKSFMKVVMKFKGDTLFTSEENIFSRFYFKLISHIQTEYRKDSSLHIPFAVEWSEGSLLSVFGSIGKDRIFVLTKEEYLEALCQIAVERRENWVLACYVIKRISQMSSKCAYFVRNFFEKKRGIQLKEVFDTLDDQYLDNVFSYEPLEHNKQEILDHIIMKKDIPFRKNLKKQQKQLSSFSNNVLFCFAK